MPRIDDSTKTDEYPTATAVPSVHSHASAPSRDVAMPVANDAARIHPTAARLFALCPWLRHFPVLGSALEGFGPVFCFSLGAVDFMTKGVAENTINLSRQPMLVKRMGVDATRYQRLAGIVSMGASMKVVMAVLSDTVAIFGYRKRWYQLGSCVIGFCFCLGYALLPAKPASADLAAAFLFLCTFSRTNVDILTQGFYSRMIQRSPQHGPALISWNYWLVLLGIIVAAAIMGPLADLNKTRDGVIVSAVCHLLPAVVFALNLYGERPNREERREDALIRRRAEADKANLAQACLPAVDAHEPTTPGGGAGDAAGYPVKPTFTAVTVGTAVVDADDLDAAVRRGDDEADLVGFSNAGGAVTSHSSTCTDEEADNDASCADAGVWASSCGVAEVNTAVLRDNWKIVCYALVMTCSVVTLACVTILGTKWQLLYASIAVIVACAVCAFLTLPLVIAKANIFVYCDMFFYIQLPGALDSFYLANETCLPGGPHFSYAFYNTVGAVIQNIAGIVGVTLFAYVFSKQRYQVVMLSTVTLRVVASIFDLIIVERWNIAIGIPDHAMYICGDAIVLQIVYMLNYLPVLMLLSRVVPHGSESMVYGLMAGIGNLGASMSGTVGSLLMEMVWPVDTKSRPCDFSNVRWLLITGHLASPFLIVVAAFLLLPRARVSDALDVNGKVIRDEAEKAAVAAPENTAQAESKMTKTV